MSKQKEPEAEKPEVEMPREGDMAIATPEDAPKSASETALMDWARENGHTAATVEELRNWAPHDMLEAYDKEQAEIAAAAPPPGADDATD
jgi:hypothetical protein